MPKDHFNVPDHYTFYELFEMRAKEPKLYDTLNRWTEAGIAIMMSLFIFLLVSFCFDVFWFCFRFVCLYDSYSYAHELEQVKIVQLGVQTTQTARIVQRHFYEKNYASLPFSNWVQFSGMKFRNLFQVLSTVLLIVR
jgi:hypothetical protein